MPSGSNRKTSLTALCGATLLLPDEEVSGATLLIENGIIAGLSAPAEIPSHAVRVALDGNKISPGFIDLQVNGGGGVLFNDGPSIDSIKTIAQSHRKFGTTSLLPTLISDTRDNMLAAIAAVQAAQANSLTGILGLHLEGPFLASAKKGIHDESHFETLTDHWVEYLAASDVGNLLMTVAPEHASSQQLERLKEAGIRISAGHTAATYEQTLHAIEKGVTGFTHLFNAMPQLHSREPGPVAAALESDAWCMLIADGHHVSDPMLRLAQRAKKDGRLILVTDAMSCAGTSANSFTLGDKLIRIENGRCTSEDGTLAGSSLTMIDAVRYMVKATQISLHEAVRYASLEPARFLGIENEVGSLTPGLRADLVILDHDVNVTATVVDGDVTSLSRKIETTQ